MPLIDINPHILNASVTHKIAGGKLRVLVIITTDLELDATASAYDKSAYDQLIADLDHFYEGQEVEYEISN